MSRIRKGQTRPLGPPSASKLPHNIYEAPGHSYAGFEPERARELVRPIEFWYTPKRDSWQNVAECELSAMTRQCLNWCRMDALGELRTQIAV